MKDEPTVHKVGIIKTPSNSIDMKLEAESLKKLYLKARLALDECILNPENNYLKDEMNFQINDISFVEDFIRVKFFKSEIEKFVIEVGLQLFSPDNCLIGKYSYYEDERGVPVDDSLVFDNY